jgi:protocatechuate 3,4-dioxygenase beta subunit
VTARTTVDVPGTTFTYTRAAVADALGTYHLRVAHPGTYEVADATVRVRPDAVYNGSTVPV